MWKYYSGVNAQILTGCLLDVQDLTMCCRDLGGVRDLWLPITPFSVEAHKTVYMNLQRSIISPLHTDQIIYNISERFQNLPERKLSHVANLVKLVHHLKNGSVVMSSPTCKL